MIRKLDPTTYKSTPKNIPEDRVEIEVGDEKQPVTASTAVTLTSSASIAQSFDIDYIIQAV